MLVEQDFFSKKFFFRVKSGPEVGVYGRPFEEISVRPFFLWGVASPEAIGCQLSGPRPHVSNGANKPEWAVGQDPTVGLIRKHGLAKHHSAHRDGHVHIAFFNRVTRPLAIDQRASLRAVMTVTALGA